MGRIELANERYKNGEFQPRGFVVFAHHEANIN